MVLQGWASVQQGREEAGLSQINQGISTYQITGAELVWPTLLAARAEVYGKLERTKEGLEAVNKALTIVDKSGERCWEAELYRLKGELTLAEGQRLRARVKEAEAYFEQAIAIARKQSAKSLELRASTSLARLWQKQGKKREAQRMLAEVYDWFTEGFDTADLKEARLLLEEE